MGRIVKNHSTHIEGLFEILISISKTEKIKSVTPGVLKKVKSNCQKMSIKINRKVRGGFKLLARKGTMAQEVYILTDLEEEKLNEIILSRL